MIVRLALAGVLAGATSFAPLQCAHDPDPTLRREDTAGDALWALSQKFEAEHDSASAKETLQYLVDTYPTNRHVADAKQEIAKLGGGATGGDAGGT
jgi:hypothetical protein